MTDQTASNIGYGQQGPTEGNSEFNAIMFSVRQMMARLDTMKLVQVKKVTGGGGAIAAAGTVDVLPLVQQIDGNLNATPHGIVTGLPWWRLQGGGGALIVDPVVGDIGYVICADRDISGVKTKKAQAPPGSLRKYNIADGIYVGGVLNSAPDKYIAFTDEGITIADGHGTVLSWDSNGLHLTGNLAVHGNITATGEITRGLGGADQIRLGTHQHPTAALGSPSSPTPGT